MQPEKAISATTVGSARFTVSPSIRKHDVYFLLFETASGKCVSETDSTKTFQPR